MTGRNAIRVGQAFGTLIAIAIIIAYAMLRDALEVTADDADHNVLVWYYDADAAPGQHLHGRAWIDGIAATISHVNVGYYGDRIGGDDCAGDCRASTVDFDFTLPADVRDTNKLDIEVVTYPTYDRVGFIRSLSITTPTISALRRLGKAGLAAALLAVQAVLLFVIKRRALRRATEPSPFWLLPIVVAGYVGFVPLMIDATRLNGATFDAIALAAWALGAYALGERLNRRIGLVRYAAVQMLVDMPATEAFRGAAVTAPIRPVDDLIDAWSALGLTVRRAGRELIVTGPGKRFAVVEVPASESVGGEPLVFRSSDGEYAELLVASASNILGELRIE